MNKKRYILRDNNQNMWPCEWTPGNKNITIQLHYALYYAGFQKNLTVQLNIWSKSSSFNKKEEQISVMTSY